MKIALVPRGPYLVGRSANYSPPPHGLSSSRLAQLVDRLGRSERTNAWSTLVEEDEQQDRPSGKSTLKLIHRQSKQQLDSVDDQVGRSCCSTPFA